MKVNEVKTSWLWLCNKWIRLPMYEGGILHMFYVLTCTDIFSTRHLLWKWCIFVCLTCFNIVILFDLIKRPDSGNSNSGSDLWVLNIVGLYMCGLHVNVSLYNIGKHDYPTNAILIHLAQMVIVRKSLRWMCPHAVCRLYLIWFGHAHTGSAFDWSLKGRVR